MKQALALAAVAAVGLFMAISPAGAGATKGPTLRSLQAQINIAPETGQDAEEAGDRRDENLAVVDARVCACCTTALTADALQDTFTGLDGYFAAHSLPPFFGAQTP